MICIDGKDKDLGPIMLSSGRKRFRANFLSEWIPESPVPRDAKKILIL